MNPRRLPLFLVAASLTAFLGLVPGQRALADFYSDRSAFNAQPLTLTTQNFENLIGTPAYPAANPPDNNVSYTYSPQGITVSGIQFVGSGSFGTETYLVTPAFGDGIYSVDGTGSLIGGRNFTDLSFPAGVTAFGTDYCLDRYWAGPNPSGSLSVTVTLRDGSVESTVISATGASRFFGYSGGEIDHIRFSSGGIGLFPYTLIDNVSFSSVVAVPEPATWWTSAGLALGLGTVVWRRTGPRRR